MVEQLQHNRVAAGLEIWRGKESYDGYNLLPLQCYQMELRWRFKI